MRVIDRGYAAIVPTGDDTVTVMVGAGLDNGLLQGVFARHAGVSGVRIGSGVAMRNGDRGKYSTEIVDVFADEAGTLHVRATRKGVRAGHADV